MSSSVPSRARVRLAAATLVGVCLSPLLHAQTYKIDDGTPGSALSYGLPQDVCWLNRLNVVGTQTLTSIEAILGDAPNGAPVTLCVWRDLAGYGRPWDGLLLTQVHTTVRNSGQQLLTEYPIPPTQVTGDFFVGAYMTVDGTLSPATLDPHTPTASRSWFCTGNGPGSFDPSYLGVYTWYALPTIGIQGVFMLRANGVDGPSPEVRCQGKTNSLGCDSDMVLTGSCSASAGAGFTIAVSNVLNRQHGLLFYGVNGGQSTPFGGGTLCVRTPLRRTAVQFSGGSPTGNDCTGQYLFDFNAWIASGLDPNLTPGTTVDAQVWSRDPGFAAGEAIGLSAAAHFGIAP